MKKYLLICSLMPLLLACGDEIKLELNQPMVRYDKFENTTSLVGQNVEITECVPSFVFITDTFAVASVFLPLAPPTVSPFHVYSTKSNKYIGKFGSVGRGPWEFLNSATIKQSYVDSIGDTHLWLENYGIFFADVNLSASLKEHKIVVNRSIEFKDSTRRTSDHIVVNDSIIMSKYADPNKELTPIYYFYNINSWQIVDSIDLYKHNKSITRENNLLATVQDIKPDRSKAVFSMLYFNAIHIADLKTGEVKSISVGKEKELSNQAMITGDYNYYYGGTATTDDYIFAIFRDVSKSLFRSARAFKLHIFDWDGRPLHEIELDSRARYISVNPKTNTLYGVDPDEGTLHKYELDAVLKNTRAAK